MARTIAIFRFVTELSSGAKHGSASWGSRIRERSLETFYGVPVLRRNQSWVILRNAHDNVWVQVTAIVAPTAYAAVLEATRGAHNPYSSGRFRAVPAKVWAKEIVL